MNGSVQTGGVEKSIKLFIQIKSYKNKSRKVNEMSSRADLTSLLYFILFFFFFINLLDVLSIFDRNVTNLLLFTAIFPSFAVCNKKI